MGRYATDTGGNDFAQVPPGTHIARCYSIIDIGTHHGEYQGTPTVRNQIIVRWEIPGEQIEGEPMIVSRFYTNSLGEKANLRKDLVAWRGKEFTTEELMGFDLANILGKPCMVTVAHNEKGKAKVIGVSGLPKGVTCPKQHNPSQVFWIDEWDDAAYEALPDGFKKLIQESDEVRNRDQPSSAPAAKSAVDDFADDVPF